MKTPYFRVTAKCDICRYSGGPLYFTVDRKTVDRVSTSGQPYRIEHLVCPNCRMWANVIEIEEVK